MREASVPFEPGAIAIGSSAGGIRALTMVLGDLPTDLPVPVFLVQHLDPRHRTGLAEVLGRRTSLPVTLAEAGLLAEQGVVYLAPPGRHLLVGPGGALALSDADLVNFVRPSADLLLESVAAAYGERAIGCVLTGSGRDGAAGLAAIKSRGGTAIVENPGTAEFKSMPLAAVKATPVDFVVPLEKIASVVCGLVASRRAR